MITEFSLENFRVFRDKATFKIKPITILTGPNNSGKSSVNLLLQIVSGFFCKIDIGSQNSSAITLKPAIDSLPLKDFVFNYFKDTYIPSVLLIDDPESSFKVSYRIKSNVINDNFSVNCKFRLYKTNNIVQIELLNLAITSCRTGVTHFQFVANDINKNGSSSYSFTSLNQNVLMDCFKEFNSSNSIIAPQNKFGSLDSINEFKDNPKKWLKDFNSSRNNDYLEMLTKLKKTAFSQNVTEEGQNSVLNNFKKLKELVFTENDDERLEKYRSLQKDYYFRHVIENVPPILIEEEINGILYITEYGFYEKTIDLSSEIFNKEELIEQALTMYDSCIKRGFLLESTVSKDIQEMLGIKSKSILPFLGTEQICNKMFRDFLKENEICSSLSDFLIGDFYYTACGFGAASYKLTELVLYDLFKSVFDFSSSVIALNPFTVPKQNNFPVLQKSFVSNLLMWYVNQKYPNRVSSLIHKNLLKDFNVCDDFIVETSRTGDQLIPVLIKSGKRLNLCDIGMGSYNLFFLILSYLKSLDESLKLMSIFIIEEPEANLHPKLQSKLAELFTQTAGLGFLSLIETHSEYFIRKLQYLVAKGECDPDDVVIYYIDNPDPEQRAPGAPQVREITLDRNGRMSHDFGPGFFDEADNLAIQLFNINQNSN